MSNQFCRKKGWSIVTQSAPLSIPMSPLCLIWRATKAAEAIHMTGCSDNYNSLLTAHALTYAMQSIDWRLTLLI